VEETITIRRSEYEQLLSVIAELRESVRQLQEEIELLKNGRNSKTGSTALSHDISRSNVHSLRRTGGKKPGGQKDNGTVRWNENVMSSLFSKATFENEKCLACKHLPICLGQCIQKMKSDKCMMNLSEKTYEQFIIDVYNKKMSSIKK
jgi:radical SAM protein with 4Fe4S-binding SPASM domain